MHRSLALLLAAALVACSGGGGSGSSEPPNNGNNNGGGPPNGPPNAGGGTENWLLRYSTWLLAAPIEIPLPGGDPVRIDDATLEFGDLIAQDVYDGHVDFGQGRA